MQVNLVYFKPDGGRKDIPLGKSNVVIGRRPDCDIRVPEIGVSRRHCELVAAGEALKVRDLDSSNGTYVNGERVAEKAVSPGDHIQIGSVVLIVQIDGQPAEVAPPVAASPQAPAAEAGVPAGLAGDDDDVFAQMLMDEDESDDSVSALELLEDEE